MRKFGKESTAPSEGVDRGSGTGWLQNHCALAVVIVAILAFVLRTVFVYGVTADGGFALSGGTDAQYHLHVVESILDGSFIIGSDAVINYPVGGLNTNPPLYDFIAAAIGAVSSASVALAVLAPIFGTLTVFPVYLIGKELKGYKVGFLAALIYGLMALPISSSVLSNGTEYAFAAFLVAIFTLAFIKVARKVNDNELAMKEILIAGLILGLIALSWNGFRLIMVLLIIVMVIQLVIDRFNSKDFKVPLFTYSIILLIGLVMGALYYVPAGLWDAVFSGPVLITAVAVVFGFIFYALRGSPWIFTIPGLIIAFIVLAVVLHFVASDLCTALIFGNSAFTNEIVAASSGTSVSISSMSSYYGWLLMWIPFILGIYEFYKYARKDRSHTQLALTMWILILWFAAWTSYGAAAAMGCVFAMASSIVIVRVFEKADLKSYYASMKQAGFPSLFRKMIKPLPFLSVLIAAFLVVIPGVFYAVDAGISSNEDYGYFAYGNTVYTVETGDGYPMEQIYENMEDANKSVGVASMYYYAADLEARGFTTVDDRFGSGSSVVSQIYLAKGSAGATAAQIVRLIQANPNTDFTADFAGYTGVYSFIKEAFELPDAIHSLILNNPDVYGKVNSDMTEENIIYFVSIEKITSSMSTYEIMQIYEKMSVRCGQEIGYYILDGSMVPLMYGDGSTLSTLGVLADYSYDTTGAISQFYSYLTYYSNYHPAIATDALYETFLWKALIGPAPSDMGYSNSFNYLYAISASDGSVKTMPGYGLAGYTIKSWDVRYTEETVSPSSDSWKYMSIEDALAKQKTDGGLINYLSSIIVYEYVGIAPSKVSAIVTDDEGYAIEGVTVQISYYNPVYGASTIYSETKTDSEGSFDALVPSTDYLVILKSGDVKLDYSYSANRYVVPNAVFDTYITVGDDLMFYDDYIYVLTKDDSSIYITSDEGQISSLFAVDQNGNSTRIVPGTYKYELRDETATAVATGSVNLYAGDNSGLTISPTCYKVTATVKDIFGNLLQDGDVIAYNTANDEIFSAAIEDGKAVISVPKGTYTFRLYGYVSDSSTTLSVTADRTLSMTAYETKDVEFQNHNNMSYNIYAGSLIIPVQLGDPEVPVSMGATKYAYTIYATDGDNVYYALYENGDSVAIQSADACKVSGSIGAAGTVKFMNDQNMVFTAAAGADGKFAMLLPSGNYTIWAYDTNNKVSLSSQSITADKDLGTLSLADGRAITATYQYASGTSKGNIGLPFAVGEISFKSGNGVYNLIGVTDTSGQIKFAIPDDSTDIKVTFNGGSIDNQYFKQDSLTKDVDAGTADAKATVLISRDNMVKHTITSEYDMTLDPYYGGTDIDYTGPMELSPGQYSAVLDTTGGYYFDGTVYVYPGQHEFSGLNVINVYRLVIEKAEGDEITITGDGLHEKIDSDICSYYLEYNVDFTVMSANPSTGYVKYAVVSETPFVGAREIRSIAIDLTTQGKLKEVKGYVGVDGSGTVRVSYDNYLRSIVDVENGEFTVEIPENVTKAVFTADVTATVNSATYVYKSVEVEADVTSGIVNVPVLLDTTDVSAEKFDGDLDAKIVSATFENGIGAVELLIFNNTSTGKSYVVNAGSAWILSNTTQVYVGPNSSESVTVMGTYEAQGTGIGSAGVSVIVSDFNGSDSITVPILDGEIQKGYGRMTLKTAADSDNKDRLVGSQYQYALTIVNEGQTDKIAISVDVASGYSVVLTDESGAIVKASGNELIVPAMDTSVIYVNVMKNTGEMVSVPSITVVTSIGTKTITASTMDLQVDSMTVSGEHAVDKKSGIPMGIWFLVGLSILLLILIVWMGSKRGVFSRR
jgi:asparagine N-glycosylation enzyme membrane subunit Stt3